MYPVTLDLQDRPVLVVGGGAVAVRKVEGLLEAGARVTVLDPSPSEGMVALEGRLKLERRPYDAGDVRGFRLVFVATDDPGVNATVSAEAEALGIWVNTADRPAECSFHVPARVRRGRLQCALASEGAAPFAVRRLRERLDRKLGSAWADWLDAAERFRGRAQACPDPEAAFDLFFSSTVDADLHARVPTAEEEEGWLSGQTPGFVSLVGAGPGDPGLLTIRARQRLETADDILSDRLARPALPLDLPPRVVVHDVGKEAGQHPVPQGEIEALMIRLARQGRRVVRLKGGDPLIFGRGSEEAEALAAAGIPFEIVPGVTAAVGVAAAVGVPLTHRGEAVRVTLVTAHSQTGQSEVPWEDLARDPRATLVIYMGVKNLASITTRLVAGGLDPSTPAILVERGTTPAQRVWRSRLADIGGTATDVQAPALLLVGAVAGHALHGRRPPWDG